MMTLLIDSGASQNLAILAALKRSPTIYEALCRNGKHEGATVRLGNDTLVKLESEFTLNSPSVSMNSCIERS